MSCGEPLPGLNGSQMGTPSGSGDNPGPKFLSLEFKSGASYEGGLDNGKKCGTGRFAWPNGAWFEGEYMNDMRQGKGERSLTLWLCFVMLRHGFCPITWNHSSMVIITAWFSQLLYNLQIRVWEHPTTKVFVGRIFGIVP